MTRNLIGVTVSSTEVVADITCEALTIFSTCRSSVPLVKDLSILVSAPTTTLLYPPNPYLISHTNSPSITITLGQPTSVVPPCDERISSMFPQGPDHKIPLSPNRPLAQKSLTHIENVRVNKGSSTRSQEQTNDQTGGFPRAYVKNGRMCNLHKWVPLYASKKENEGLVIHEATSRESSL